MRSSERRETRDLPELQSRHEGTQRAHLPQPAKMAVPEVQEGPNAGAQAALAEMRLARPLRPPANPQLPGIVLGWNRRSSVGLAWLHFRIFVNGFHEFIGQLFQVARRFLWFVRHG